MNYYFLIPLIVLSVFTFVVVDFVWLGAIANAYLAVWVCWVRFRRKSTLGDRMAWFNVGCLFLLGIWFSYLHDTSVSDPWFGIMWADNRYCGRSPCSRTPDQDVTPYNPNGFFPTGTHTAERGAVLGICPFAGCRWADNNGLPQVGWEAPDGVVLVGGETGPYASARPADSPNWAMGFTGGFLEGVTTTDQIQLCPGVSSVTNSAGYVGTGLYPCTVCSPVSTRCPAQRNRWVCLMCTPQELPGPTLGVYACWFWAWSGISLVIVLWRWWSYKKEWTSLQQS